MKKSTIWAGAFVGMLAVSPVFALPAAAQDRQDRQQEHRMYDSAHRDYHNWNTDEDQRYREFMKEHHRKYRDFSRLSKRQQNEYWQWRHDHDTNERR
jgi:hypothetical protein